MCKELEASKVKVILWYSLGPTERRTQRQAAITFHEACGYLHSFPQMAPTIYT